MRSIYFLNISLCLLFNVAVFCSAELEKTDYARCLGRSNHKGRFDWDKEDAKQDNPLKQLKTYLNDKGNFTLAKAKELIGQKAKEGEDIVNSPGTSASRSNNNPLKWLCFEGVILKHFITKENRLKMAQFFLGNGANNASIKEALLDCESEPAPHRIEANLGIKEFLCSVKTEKGIEINEREIEEMRKFKIAKWKEVLDWLNNDDYEFVYQLYRNGS